MSDRSSVDNLRELSNAELMNIVGGLNLSGALVQSFTKAITAILDVGRSLGTALKRVITKKSCPAK